MVAELEVITYLIAERERALGIDSGSDCVCGFALRAERRDVSD